MTLLERLQAASRERDALYHILWMWEQCKAQGIAIEHVQSWTFCDAFLSPQDKGKNLHLTHHNAIRLLDGSLVKLNPMIEKP